MPKADAEKREDDIYRLACSENGEEGYGEVEAKILYYFVRHFRPRRILQIGCGVTTSICLQAASAAEYELELTCIEPNPNSYLNTLAGAGRITLYRQKVQDVDSLKLEDLSDGDLFFVDSTHTLGPAGEVSRIILELLPRLHAGVFVHFHDILFPYDYMPDLLEGSLFFPHESVLLHAFLTHNSDFEILVSLSMLHHESPDELRKIIPDYTPALQDQGLATKPGHFPSALFMWRSRTTIPPPKVQSGFQAR